MKKLELIKALQEIEQDFDVILKTPNNHALDINKVIINEDIEMIIIYSE